MLFLPLSHASDPAPARVNLITFSTDGEPVTHDFNLWVCDNPACGCSNVSFVSRRASQEQINPSEATPRPSLRFDLDVHHRRFAPNSLTDPQGHILGKALAESLREDDWRWLADHFRACKDRLLAEMDIDTVPAAFPPDVAAKPGKLVAYQEIFPWARSLKFQSAEVTWLADDMHCSHPNCTCTDVALTFYAVPPPGADSKSYGKPLLFLRRDLVTGRITILEQSPQCPAPISMMESLQAAHPNLDSTLRLHQQQIHRLAKRLLGSPEAVTLAAAPSTTFIRESPKTGRNDPCPCGSGRKFKKCCGIPQ